jgi:hypothetical protein
MTALELTAILTAHKRASQRSNRFRWVRRCLLVGCAVALVLIGVSIGTRLVDCDCSSRPILLTQGV